MHKKIHLTLLFLAFTAFSFAQDTNTVITPDDFPVTNSLIASNKNTYPEGDHVWFTNKHLNQTLVFELGTDYHRYKTYLFYNDNIPKDLLDDDWFPSAQENTSNKVETFKTYIKNAALIGRKYFVTLHGLQLRDTKKKILQLYSYKPDEITDSNGIEKYAWNFPGDVEITEGREKQKEKPIAKDSFGYHFTAYFKNETLIAITIENDIP